MVMSLGWVKSKCQHSRNSGLSSHEDPVQQAEEEMPEALWKLRQDLAVAVPELT